MAAALDQSQVAHYLLSLGLVNPRAVLEEDLTVTDVSRRNAVFLATDVAPARRTSSSRPARRAPRRWRTRPPCCARSRRAGAGRAGARARALRRRTRCGSCCARRRRRATGASSRPPAALAARALGRALPPCTRARPTSRPLPPARADCGACRCPSRRTSGCASSAPARSTCCARVQASDDAVRAAAALARRPRRRPRFVHGDLRWDNCLAVAAPGRAPAHARAADRLGARRAAATGAPTSAPRSPSTCALWVELDPDRRPGRPGPARRPRAASARAPAAGDARALGRLPAARARPPAAARVTELAAVRLLQTRDRVRAGRCQRVTGARRRAAAARRQHAADARRRRAANLLGLRE